MRSGVGKSVQHHDPVPCLLSAGVIAMIRFPFQCDTTKFGDDYCQVSGRQTGSPVRCATHWPQW